MLKYDTLKYVENVHCLIIKKTNPNYMPKRTEKLIVTCQKVLCEAFCET